MLESRRSPLRKLDGTFQDIIGIPWHLAFSLREGGWYLRQDIIWYRASCSPNPSRPLHQSYEHVFLLSKSLFF